MQSQFKLIGLSKPSSATIEYGKEQSCNAIYHWPQSLWDYVENNWENVNLKALVEHEGLSSDGTPINPVVLSVLES